MVGDAQAILHLRPTEMIVYTSESNIQLEVMGCFF